MRRILVPSGLVVAIALSIGVQAQRVPADQWPNYQHNSNFSPLTQITPENVSRLTKAVVSVNWWKSLSASSYGL